MLNEYKFQNSTYVKNIRENGKKGVTKLCYIYIYIYIIEHKKVTQNFIFYPTILGNTVI